MLLSCRGPQEVHDERRRGGRRGYSMGALSDARQVNPHGFSPELVVLTLYDEDEEDEGIL